MDKSNNRFETGEKKFNLISVMTVLIGAVTLVCLLFFFSRSFHADTGEIPVIYSAEQIGSTDSSVLISWSCSENAKEFSVLYSETGKNSFTEIKTAQPFAALHQLKPFCRYDVRILPLDDNHQSEPFSLECGTAPYCHVTSVEASEIGNDSALIKWQYEGKDEGFSIAVYAVDNNGKRRLTADIIDIPVGAEQQVLVSGLLSDIHYSVCVMPQTKYMTVGKSTFTTTKYSGSSEKVNIIRFVICPYDTDYSFTVRKLTELTPDNPYKSSVIYNGPGSSEDTVDLTLYITDEENHLISVFTKKNIHVNPDGDAAYVSRIMMSEFKSPETAGQYYLYLAIDGVTVKRTNFSVNE